MFGEQLGSTGVWLNRHSVGPCKYKNEHVFFLLWGFFKKHVLLRYNLHAIKSIPFKVYNSVFCFVCFLKYLFIWLYRVLVAVRGLVSSCGVWAQLPHGMWDHLGPGIEPMSPTLESRFAAIKPPEKSLFMCLEIICLSLEKMALQILCPFLNWVTSLFF